MSPFENCFVINSSAAAVVAEDNYEIVPMELDDTVPEPLILERSDSLSTLLSDSQQRTDEDQLSTFDWSSFDTEVLGDVKNELSKSGCSPITTKGLTSTNNCGNGNQSVQFVSAEQHLTEEERRHQEDLKFLDDLNTDSLFFDGNASSGDISDAQQNASMNYNQNLETYKSSYGSAANTNSYLNCPNVMYTSKGSLVSLRPTMTTYKDRCLFKIPAKHYCAYCLKFFWNASALQRHTHKSKKRILQCWKCHRSFRTLDQLTRHFYFYHDTTVMRFRPALPHF